MEILIGVIGSLVASFVWWGLGQLYAVDSRKKINYQLIQLRNNNALYEKCLEYKDYNLALSQSQRMLTEIGEIVALIKPLTYTRKKRKLINTLLENLRKHISIFQSYYEGYETSTEKEVCCEKAIRHLFIVGYKVDESGKQPNPNCFQSVSSVTIALLSDLNFSKKSVKYILANSFCFNSNNVDIRKKYYLDLIDVNAFRDSYSKGISFKFQSTTDILKRKEYEKLIGDLSIKNLKK